MSRDILTLIQSNMGTFSKGQKLIGRFILENYDKAAFMTAAKLGQTVRISESTVVRFAAELGFDGYPAMQRALQEMIRSKLTTVQRIEVSNDRLGDHDLLEKVVQSDIEKIRTSLEELSREEFSAIVEAIVKAKHIYILGVRSAAALSDFLAFYFNLIFDNVRQVHTTLSSEMFEQMLRVGEGDVVIGISFPRYSSRAANYFQSLGIKRGDRVLLILKRHYQFWFAILGLHKLGAVALLASNQMMTHDLEYRYQAAGISAATTPNR